MAAIQEFCKHHGEPMLLNVLTSVIITLREQEDYDWTPHGKFRKIRFTKARIERGKWIVCTVFGHVDIDEALTDELNAAIHKSCHGMWADPDEE